MRTEYMREFVNLARSLSFTKTASEFYIAQSTLSKHIKSLEDELGTSLINRSTHEVTLTESGKLAYEHFQKILADYDDMVHGISMADMGFTGSISLGFYNFGGMELLGNGIDRFYSKYPGVELSAFTYPLYQIIESLRDGGIDVGLTFKTNSLPKGDFEFKELGEYEWEAVVYDTNPLAAKNEVTFDDLRSQPMVQPKMEVDFTEMQLQLLEDQGFEPSRIIYCNRTTLVPNMLKAKGGYFIGVNSFQNEHIIGLPISDCNIRIPAGLYYRKDNANPSIPCFLSCF